MIYNEYHILSLSNGTMMSDNAEAPKEHFSCLPRSDCNALYYAFQRKKKTKLLREGLKNALIFNLLYSGNF